MLGTIRRRLLINAVVDPDEAALRLPRGVRPHVTEQGTVVGCCLLEIDAIRPAGVPAVLGQHLRAVAHRISAEWDDTSGAAVTGVYVPVRYTNSSLAITLGGRWFPGVHERARIDVSTHGTGLRWRSQPARSAGLGIRVVVVRPPDDAAEVCDAVGATCLGASVGISPDRRGRPEAARMEPAHRQAETVSIDALDSEFLDGFVTAQMAASYLMCDADVTWTRDVGPATATARSPA